MPVLSNLKTCDSLLVINAALQPAAVVKNERTIVDIMEVYAFNELTETFGNIPYSQALNYNNLTPVYDDAKTIQQDLQKRLTADIAALDPTNGSFAATEDLFYGGVVSKWITFANTLQIKIAMTLADVDDANTRAIVEANNAKAFQTTATDVVWQYLAVPNNNPTYQALVLSGRSDYVACTKLINNLISMQDPRLPFFFGTNTTGSYAGILHRFHGRIRLRYPTRCRPAVGHYPVYLYGPDGPRVLSRRGDRTRLQYPRNSRAAL